MLKSAFFKLNGGQKIEETSNHSAVQLWRQNIPNYTAIEEKIKERFYVVVKTFLNKVDQRKDFFTDAVFFCLLEVSDFTFLLAPHIGCANLDANDHSIAVDMVKSNIIGR